MVSWVIATGLITYIKVSVASIFRLEGGRALFWCGAVQQMGSAVGALLFFFIINYTHTFTSYSPCEWLIGSQFFIGFEVLTVLVVSNPVFWDVMPFNLLKIHPCVRGNCHLDLQGWRMSYRRNQHEADSSAWCWILAWLIFQPWSWRQLVRMKYEFSFSGLHSDASQKIECLSILWFNSSDFCDCTRFLWYWDVALKEGHIIAVSELWNVVRVVMNTQ